jgi:hypothetical protein
VVVEQYLQAIKAHTYPEELLDNSFPEFFKKVLTSDKVIWLYWRLHFLTDFSSC